MADLYGHVNSINEQLRFHELLQLHTKPGKKADFHALADIWNAQLQMDMLQNNFARTCGIKFKDAVHLRDFYNKLLHKSRQANLLNPVHQTTAHHSSPLLPVGHVPCPPPGPPPGPPPTAMLHEHAHATAPWQQVSAAAAAEAAAAAAAMAALPATVAYPGPPYPAATHPGLAGPAGLDGAGLLLPGARHVIHPPSRQAAMQRMAAAHLELQPVGSRKRAAAVSSGDEPPAKQRDAPGRPLGAPNSSYVCRRCERRLQFLLQHLGGLQGEPLSQEVIAAAMQKIAEHNTRQCPRKEDLNAEWHHLISTPPSAAREQSLMAVRKTITKSLVRALAAVLEPQAQQRLASSDVVVQASEKEIAEAKQRRRK
jgi:hypothetical protein